jgi:nucleotide-binding universal stress UspA family protein
MEGRAMFANVVVPLDGSALAENALPAAAAVARSCGARLVVVRVVRTLAEEVEADRELRAATEQLGAIRTEVVAERGRGVARAIADVAAESPDPLVCMSTHGRGGLGRAVLGSVAEGVLQQHPGPLLLIGPHADIGALPLVGRVTACVDGTPTAAAILPLARRWAETFGMDLELLHVADPQAAPPPLLERLRGVDDAGDGSAGERAHLQTLERSSPAEDATPDPIVLRGWRPEPVIAAHIEDSRPGVVAMATRARGGLARFTLGSVAMAVVHRSRRPVLVQADPAPR